MTLPWMNIANAELGVTEIRGFKHAPRVLEYHATTTLDAKEDEVPWCASFVSWVFVEAKLVSKRSARARDWLNWGQQIDKPVYGAIVVFERGGGGHVGFYVGERDDKYLVLGGNQSNKVSIAAYDKSRLLGIRWPADYPLPTSIAPLAKSGVMQGAAAAAVAGAGPVLAEMAKAGRDNADMIQSPNLIIIAFGVMAVLAAGFVAYSRIKGRKEP